MVTQYPIIEFTLRCPNPTGSLPFTATDQATYTSQYSTWLSTLGGANNAFKANGGSITLYGEQAIYLKKLVDSRQIGGTYKVFSKIVEGNLTSFYLSDSASCWAIAAGPNDSVWAMDRINDGLWQVNTKTEQVTFHSVPSTTFIDICLGSDGNLWVANSGSGAGIVRVTTGGSATAFAINSDENTSLTGISTGSDGNIWTSDDEGNVFKVGTDGSVIDTYTLTDPDTEFTLYSYYSCLGGDGNIWIVDGRGGVWKVETDGTATKYSNGSPSFLTNINGPDNLVWLTVLGAEKLLWRVGTNGDFTQYSIPINIDEIATGPDGNIWGVSWASYSKFSPSDGSTVVYHTPDLTGRSICLGPDNNMWLGCNSYVRRIS